MACLYGQNENDGRVRDIANVKGRKRFQSVLLFNCTMLEENPSLDPAVPFKNNTLENNYYFTPQYSSRVLLLEIPL